MVASDTELNALAKNGVIEWAVGVIKQADAIRHAFNERMLGNQEGHIMLRVSEHFFLIAANNLYRFVDLACSRGVVEARLFEPLESFRKDVRELRDMREHVIEYWTGGGKYPQRFRYDDPDSVMQYGRQLSTLASQSTFIGGVHKIGGRLELDAFAKAVSKLLENFR
jgi:hypothetical protein